MQAESIFLSFLSIFVLVGFFITLTVQKFSHLILNGILLDTELTKPQAFHRTPIPRSGGLASIILFSVFILMYYFFFNNFIADYLFIGLSLFFIGAIYFYISTTNLFKLAFTASIIFTISFLPYWVSWNFNGYENKEQWSDIENLYTNLKRLSNYVFLY